MTVPACECFKNNERCWNIALTYCWWYASHLGWSSRDQPGTREGWKEQQTASRKGEPGRATQRQDEEAQEEEAQNEQRKETRGETNHLALQLSFWPVIFRRLWGGLVGVLCKTMSTARRERGQHYYFSLYLSVTWSHFPDSVLVWRLNALSCVPDR